MDKVLLIGLCLLAGLLLKRYKLVPEDSARTVNQLLVHFFMPALILFQITELSFDTRFLFPVLAAWIIFSLAFLFFNFLGKWKNLPPKTVATLIITGGISSTSFVGFPIFELLYGKQGLQLAILMSQAGSFLIGITLGVAVATWCSSAQPSKLGVVKQVFRFPPFLAFVAALALNLAGIHFPHFLHQTLSVLSAPYAVLALLSVGLQIHLGEQEMEVPLLGLGLLYKLLLAPLFIFLLYRYGLRQDDFIVTTSVMGAAIGPMNTAAIIAGKYNLHPRLASHMVAVGIPLSLPVLYLIHLLLS